MISSSSSPIRSIWSDSLYLSAPIYATCRARERRSLSDLNRLFLRPRALTPTCLRTELCTESSTLLIRIFERGQRFPRRVSWNGSPFERRRKVGVRRDRRPPGLLLLPDFRLRHVLPPVPRHSLRSLLLSPRLGKRTLSLSLSISLTPLLICFMLSSFQHAVNSSLWDFLGWRCYLGLYLPAKWSFRMDPCAVIRVWRGTVDDIFTITLIITALLYWFKMRATESLYQSGLSPSLAFDGLTCSSYIVKLGTNQYMSKAMKGSRKVLWLEILLSLLISPWKLLSHLVFDFLKGSFFWGGVVNLYTKWEPLAVADT